LGLPLGFERGPEPLIFLGVFAGDEGAAGTQAVSEGVEAHGGLPLRGDRAGRMLGILAVCYLLLF